MEYLVEPQFDTVFVQNFQVADSKTINLSKIIPATEHLILLEVFSRDLLQPFVPTLAGNFLLLLEMEYPVEPQFDTVSVKDLQVADSAANVKVLEMLVGLDSQFYALRFVLSVITSLIFKSEILGPENLISTRETAINPQLLLSSLIQCCSYI